MADACDRLTHGDRQSFCQEFALSKRAKTHAPTYPTLCSIKKMVHFVKCSADDKEELEDAIRKFGYVNDVKLQWKSKMSRVTEQTNTFAAQSQSGKNYTIYEYTTFEVVQYLDGEEKIPVSKSLKTSSGHSVNILSRGEYEVLDSLSHTRVTSTDKNSP